MEVRPGYKRTEVGVIPEDWDAVPLGDLGKLKNGINKNSESFGHGSPFVNLMDVFGVSRIVSNEALGLVATNAVEQQTYDLRKGDVVFIRSSVKPSGVGLTAVVERDLPGTVYSGFLIRFRDNGKLSDSFKQYCFYEEGFRRRAIGASSVSANTNINQDNLKRLALALPSTKAEQEAIAGALSDADAFIESLEQLLAKKSHLKQGAMLELLTGKKCLPGFSGEWKTTSLGSTADADQRWTFTGGPFGSNLKSSDYTDAGVRVIQLQNIGDGEFKNDYEIYTSRQKADELLSCNIYPGEIILSKMGDPVARACIIPAFHDRYVMCSDGIRLAVDEKRFNIYFVYTQINAPEFREKAASAGTGSTRKRIGLTELRDLELRCPPLPEQNAIAAILSDMDAEIAGLEEKLAKACNLKEGMMQELLTGSIRLV